MIVADVFGVHAPFLQITYRTIIIYVVIVLLMRLMGRRQLGQMTPFDLVLILLIANAVQNAMVGSDTTIFGGLVAAAALLVSDQVLSRVVDRIPRFRRIVEGQTDPARKQRSPAGAPCHRCGPHARPHRAGNPRAWLREPRANPDGRARDRRHDQHRPEWPQDGTHAPPGARRAPGRQFANGRGGVLRARTERPGCRNRWLRVETRQDDGSISPVALEGAFRPTERAIARVEPHDAPAIDFGRCDYDVRPYEDALGRGRALTLISRVPRRGVTLRRDVVVYDALPYCVSRVGVTSEAASPLPLDAMHVFETSEGRGRLQLESEPADWRVYRTGWQSWSPTMSFGGA